MTHASGYQQRDQQNCRQSDRSRQQGKNENKKAGQAQSEHFTAQVASGPTGANEKCHGNSQHDQVVEK
jgi:hypothetical protein